MPRLSRKRNQQRSQRRQQRSQRRQQRSQGRQQRSQRRQSQRRQRGGGKMPHLKTPHCKKAIANLSFKGKLAKGPSVGSQFGKKFSRDDLQAASKAKYMKKKGNCHVYLRRDDNRQVDGRDASSPSNMGGCSIDLATVQGKPGFFKQLEGYNLMNPNKKMAKAFRRDLNRPCHYQ